MCGRYVLAEHADLLYADFGAQTEQASFTFHPNFNVAPTTLVPVVIGAESAGGLPTREIILVRWGIVPRWATGKTTLLVNARGESVAEKATFKRAFAHSRCIIPASGYYEWKRPEKDPYYIRRADTSPLAMAGLISECEIEGVNQWACVIITLPAALNIKFVHDRMPATIPRSLWDVWLDRTVGSGEARTMLSGDTELHASPVSRRVNSIRNNDPSLLVLEDAHVLPPHVLF